MEFAKTSQIICLAGSYSSGKSTLAKSVQSVYKQTLVLPMAEALRQELIEHYGMSAKEVYSKPTPLCIREAMHNLGDSRRRVYGEIYWAERWALQVLKANKPLVICDDMRFMTDWNYIKAFDAKAKLVYLGPTIKDSAYDLSSLKAIADLILPTKPSVNKLLSFIDDNK